jgi:hypothetical protein
MATVNGMLFALVLAMRAQNLSFAHGFAHVFLLLYVLIMKGVLAVCSDPTNQPMPSQIHPWLAFQ